MNDNPQDIYKVSSDPSSGSPGGNPYSIPPGFPPGSVPPGSAPPGGVVYYPVPVGRRTSPFWTVFWFFCGLILFGFFSFVFFAALLSSMVEVMQSGAIATESRLPEKFVSGNKNAVSKIAILTISGTIIGNEDGFVKKQIDAVKKDSKVEAVVLRIVSPGGTISGSDYYLAKLKELKKERNIPIIVSMGSVATSGGYYVAMAGDKIYAEQTTITGSIGVIAPMYDISELCEKVGFESNPIVSGPMKSMGNITKPMSEEERKIWQNLIDENFAHFKQIVRDGRANFAAAPEKLDELATGQIYTADQALDNGLIDAIGFVDDAVKDAMNRVRLSENNCKVVKYDTTKGLVNILLEGKSKESQTYTHLLQTVATPQLYYLMPGAIPLMEE